MNLFPISLQGWRVGDTPLLTSNGYPQAINVLGVEWRGRIVWVTGQTDRIDLLGNPETRQPLPIENLTRDQLSPLLGRYPKPVFLLTGFSQEDQRAIEDVFQKSLLCYSINLVEVFSFHLINQIAQLKAGAENISGNNLECRLTKMKIGSLEIEDIQKVTARHFCSQYLSLLPIPLQVKKHPTETEYAQALNEKNFIKNETCRWTLRENEQLGETLDRLIGTFSTPFMMSKENGLKDEEREQIKRLCSFCKMWREKLELPSYSKDFIQDRIENIDQIAHLIRPIRNRELVHRFLVNLNQQIHLVDDRIPHFKKSADALVGDDSNRAFSEILSLTRFDHAGNRFTSYEDMSKQAEKLLDVIWKDVGKKRDVNLSIVAPFIKHLAAQWAMSCLNMLSTLKGGEDFSSSDALNNVTLRVFHNLTKIQKLIQSEPPRVGKDASHELVIRSHIIKKSKQIIENFDCELSLKIKSIMACIKILLSDKEMNDENLIRSDTDTGLAFFLRNLDGAPDLSSIEKELFPLLKEAIQDKSIIEPLVAIANFRDDLLAIRDLKDPPANQTSADDIIEWIDFTPAQSASSAPSPLSVAPSPTNVESVPCSSSSASPVPESPSAASVASPAPSPVPYSPSVSPFSFSGPSSSPPLSTRSVPTNLIVDVASQLRRRREEEKKESEPQRISFFNLRKRDVLNLLHEHGFRATGQRDRNNHPIYLHDLTGVTASPAWHSSYDRITPPVAQSLRESVEESIRRSKMLRSARQNT